MRDIYEFLEREAGHVVIALILMGIGYLLWAGGMPKAEDVLPFSLGLMARSMVGPKEGK